MIPKSEIPAHVLYAFQNWTQKLGGEFVQQHALCPETFIAHCLVMDRPNEDSTLTRLMLLHEGHVFLHSHKSFSETIGGCELLGKTIGGNAYGHLLGSHTFMISLDRLIGTNHTFQPGEIHGINVLQGFVILEVTITGDYDTDDLIR